MKRDMDLGRKILLELEREKYDGSPQIYELPMIEDYSEAEIEYHVGLLQEAGLLLARVPFDGSPLIPYKLTSQGHDFLDVARNQTTWEKAKKVVREKGGAATFSVFNTVLGQLALEQFKRVGS